MAVTKSAKAQRSNREETVVLLEPNRDAFKKAQGMIQSLGYPTVGVEGVEATMRLVATQKPALVLANYPKHEPIMALLRESGLGHTGLVASFSPKVAKPQSVARALGADAFLVRPYRKEALAAVLHSSLVCRQLRRDTDVVLKELAEARSRLARFGATDPKTHFYHFEFFKELLLFEILRAKRYGYGLALCLIAIDPLPEGVGLSVEQRKEVEIGVALAIRGGIRDIDVPVHYSENRYLVFLPHTDLTGAERVGRRIGSGIRKNPFSIGGVVLSLSASVGISGLRAGTPVSFARLIREAQTALRAAQLKGGNQVIART
jgi:diguanylate cyclase (GGDEF)-like protein